MPRLWLPLTLLLIGHCAHADDNETPAATRESALESFRRARDVWKADQAHPEAALPFYRHAAEQGIADAQAFLGWAYLDGKGVQRDVDAARTWFDLAAAQGHPYAVYMLAFMYGRGDGVPADTDKADAFIRRAAELYYPDALLTAAGQGFRKDADAPSIARAFAYLNVATERGDVRAMFMLGKAHLDGRHVPQDFAQAFTWLQKASRAKEAAHAGLWVAHCYAHGLGVKRDTARAEKLFADLQANLSVSEVNNFAWELAVSPIDVARDGARAVALMNAKLTDPKVRKYQYLDTLAAAYAEANDFKHAIETQKEAIGQLRSTPDGARRDQGFAERLALYEAGKPYREQL
jgi:TPR repeat protein